ncbi:MFS transporter [Embleya sp. NBC_00896]|uniref:MFS transporter n=1 Tax=Embleya sp. NBC_00896 TaxID=2975961 RepID=UPI002F916376|nr:MFS transporter [Embleya sp. NBC_00896]
MSHGTPPHPTVDERPDPGEDGPDPAPGRRWSVLTLVCLAQFMLVLDVTVVNVALPSMGADLGLGRETLTWVVTAYALAFGGLMLLGGRIADLLGGRTAFLVGLAVFTAASAAAGLAPNGEVLLAGRVAQGAAAALLSPAALALVTVTFRGPDRNRALGVWAAIGGTGAAAGVLVGGLLTSGPGWEWIFFANVPIGLAVLAGARTVLPARTARTSSGRLDLPGAITATAATTLLILGVTRAGADGWGSPWALVPLTGSALGYAAFVLVERRTREPLVPPRLATRRPVVSGAFVMLVASGLLIPLFFLGSMYLQQRLGFGALRTGLAFLPVAVAVTAGAHLGGVLVGRVGPRTVGAAGLAIAAAGALLLSRLPGHGGGAADVVPGLAIAAAGIGPAFVAATTTAMAHVSHHEAGLTSGLVNTFHELGGALGVALTSALAASSLAPGARTVDGYTDAFLACGLVAAGAAVLIAVLLPAGVPPAGDGPRHLH